MKARNKGLKALSVVLTLTLLCGSVSGCGNSEETDDGKGNVTPGIEAETASQEDTSSEIVKEPEETVNINWYRVAWHTNEDEKEVEAAINEYIEPLIGVTVTIMNDAESTALDLALAAGDDIDVYWTASWANGYGYIDGNSAYDLTELLPQYEGLYNSIPENVWEAAQIDGKNYYVPVYKEAATGTSLSIPTAVVEKYGWNLSTIHTLKDIEPMIKEAAEDGMKYPFGVFVDYYNNMYGLDEYAFIDAYAGVALDGDTGKVVNIMETAEYEEYIRMKYDWNQKGYIGYTSVEGINGESVKEAIADGESAFFGWTNTPDGKNNASIRYGQEMELVRLTEDYITTDSPFGSAYMINSQTENVDACLKFLELLSTDETLANLAAFGIEGEHYTRNGEGRISLIADSGYSYPGVWIVCNLKAPGLLEGEAEDKKEQYDEFNKNAQASILAGFRFDSSAVEAEVTALSGVLSEYQGLLERGFYDPDEYLPEFRKALAAAGIDKVIAEMQTQYDAFLSSK